MKSIFRDLFRKRKKGASLIEVSLVVGLIAIVAIPTIRSLGNELSKIFQGIDAGFDGIGAESSGNEEDDTPVWKPTVDNLPTAGTLSTSGGLQAALVAILAADESYKDDPAYLEATAKLREDIVTNLENAAEQMGENDPRKVEYLEKAAELQKVLGNTEGAVADLLKIAEMCKKNDPSRGAGALIEALKLDPNIADEAETENLRQEIVTNLTNAAEAAYNDDDHTAAAKAMLVADKLYKGDSDYLETTESLRNYISWDLAYAAAEAGEQGDWQAEVEPLMLAAELCKKFENDGYGMAKGIAYLTIAVGLQQKSDYPEALWTQALDYIVDGVALEQRKCEEYNYEPYTLERKASYLAAEADLREKLGYPEADVAALRNQALADLIAANLPIVELWEHAAELQKKLDPEADVAALLKQGAVRLEEEADTATPWSAAWQLKDAAKLQEKVGDPAGAADYLAKAAEKYLLEDLRYRYYDAAECLQQAADLQEKAGNPAKAADYLTKAADTWIKWNSGSLNTAADELARAMKLDRDQVVGTEVYNQVLNNLTTEAERYKTGNSPHAADLLVKAAALDSTQAGTDLWNTVLNNLTTKAEQYKTSSLPNAANHLVKAAALDSTQVGTDLWNTVLNNLTTKAEEYVQNNDYEPAGYYLQRAADMQEKAGDSTDAENSLKQGAAMYQQAAAICLQNNDDYTVARSYLEQAANMQEKAGDSTGAANSLKQIADIYLQEESYWNISNYLKQAVDLLEKAGGSETTINSWREDLANSLKTMVDRNELGYLYDGDSSYLEVNREDLIMAADLQEKLGNSDAATVLRKRAENLDIFKYLMRAY